VALIENGSWAPAAGNLMRELLGCMKQITLLGPTLNLRSALKPAQVPELEALADAVADSLLAPEQVVEQVQPRQGYVCKLCGYVYEGEELPPDFACPLCKRGGDYFELRDI
jgi:rubredoxin